MRKELNFTAFFPIVFPAKFKSSKSSHLIEFLAF